MLFRSLTDIQLRHFYSLALEAGLAALVEVHDAAELRRANAAGAELLGVNNRDLKTFTTDLGVTFRLAKRIPADKLIVSESGIHTRNHVTQLVQAGVHAMLIGESLIRAEHTGDKVRELLGVKAGNRQPA